MCLEVMPKYANHPRIQRKLVFELIELLLHDRRRNVLGKMARLNLSPDSLDDVAKYILRELARRI